MNKTIQLQQLHQKVNSGNAKESEIQQYFELLRADNRITQKQINEYNKGINKDLVLKGIVAVGGAALVFLLLRELLKK